MSLTTFLLLLEASEATLKPHLRFEAKVQLLSFTTNL